MYHPLKAGGAFRTIRLAMYAVVAVLLSVPLGLRAQQMSPCC